MIGAGGGGWGGGAWTGGPGTWLGALGWQLSWNRYSGSTTCKSKLNWSQDTNRQAPVRLAYTTACLFHAMQRLALTCSWPLA